MLCLTENWDGFGTGPISDPVYRIAKRLVILLDRDDVKEARVFVGVNTPGSLFVVVDQLCRQIEMTVVDNGDIFFDEFIGGVYSGAGMFVMSDERIEALLNQ